MGALPFDAGISLFVRGDGNDDGRIDLSDAIFILLYLFRGDPFTPVCLDACDSNDDGTITTADTIYLLLYLYCSGDAPPAPFPEEGIDATFDDGLGCGG